MSEEAQENEIKLTPQQKLFCEFYVGVCNLNATKAAIRAGYAKSCARSTASRLRTIDNISAYISHKLKELTMPSDEILVGFTNEAKGSIADVLEPDGTFNFENMVQRGSDKLLKKLKIKTVKRRDKDSEETVEETTHEFEMYDAQAAKVHLGKAQGIFTDKIEHAGTIQTVAMTRQEWLADRNAKRAELETRLQTLDDAER